MRQKRFEPQDSYAHFSPTICDAIRYARIGRRRIKVVVKALARPNIRPHSRRPCRVELLHRGDDVFFLADMTT